MSLTRDMSHAEISWLKTRVLKNMWLTSVTLDMFHLEISWLNSSVAENIFFMSVTSETSQFSIGPFGPSLQSPIGDKRTQSLTAFLSSNPDFGLNASGEHGR